MATSSTWIKKLRPNPPKPEVVSDEEMENATGNCFMAAIDTLTEWYLTPTDPGEEWFITHALVQHPETGKYHWHAWNEREKTYDVPYRDPSGELKTQPVVVHTVVDNSNGKKNEIPAGMYYNIGNVRCVRRYSLSEVQDRMAETMHAGPWHEWDEDELAGPKE